MALSSKDLYKRVREWMIDIESVFTKGVGRTWCLFGFDKIFSQPNIAEFFDRKELNQKYRERLTEKNTQLLKPYAQFQVEINNIYGFHKSFVSRHKTRLQCYKDDLSQKALRLQHSLVIASNRIEKFKDDLNGSK